MDADITTDPPILSREEPSLFLDFPPEIHFNILECADVSQYPTLRLVCSKWNNFIENTLPLGRYVPANIEFKPPPPDATVEGAEELHLCTDPSLWLMHRGVLIFSKFRMDPRPLGLKRIMDGVDIVNSPVTKKIWELKAGEEATGTPLAITNEFVAFDRVELTEKLDQKPPGLFCGDKDISRYLSDPVYVLNPSHPQYKNYKGLVKILQNWRFVPRPQATNSPSMPGDTVRGWIESFLDRYDWGEFDKDLEKVGPTEAGTMVSSVEVEMKVVGPDHGYWKPSKPSEEKEMVKEHQLEIFANFHNIGCRFQSAGRWKFAGRDSPTGFTFMMERKRN
ncbi:hypothetical protein TWF481_004566 [Arthrobotrys musiformis]|uniref:F-box domain-containing protein n=1 Tax=Arthrobotrys musiformis TaxID=47236 RepID=A0AAV9WM09_9PEZI